MFGSFSSVIISRLKNGKSGIASGRSECPKCHHVL
jgi:prepilin signal peptidase PulO-like enzyme (type II secretory pathway)